MTFYTGIAATAHRLLTQFGGPVTLTRTVPGAYNPATGQTDPATTTTYSGTGAKFDYSQRDIDGTLIRMGDQRVYMSVEGMTTPQTGDTLTAGGRTFQVVASRPLNPAGTVVLHDVQVRGV